MQHLHVSFFACDGIKLCDFVKNLSHLHGCVEDFGFRSTHRWIGGTFALVSRNSYANVRLDRSIMGSTLRRDSTNTKNGPGDFDSRHSLTKQS